jgi:hypothetical protein
VLLTGGRRDFDVKAQWYPSGTLNTVPESDVVLKNALGGTPDEHHSVDDGVERRRRERRDGRIGDGPRRRQPIQIGVLGGSAPGTYIRWLTAAYAGARRSPGHRRCRRRARSATP